MNIFTTISKLAESSQKQIAELQTQLQHFLKLTKPKCGSDYTAYELNSSVGALEMDFFDQHNDDVENQEREWGEPNLPEEPTMWL